MTSSNLSFPSPTSPSPQRDYELVKDDIFVANCEDCSGHSVIQSFVLVIPSACAPEFFNVTWKGTFVGRTSMQQCPNNAEGKWMRNIQNYMDVDVDVYVYVYIHTYIHTYRYSAVQCSAVQCSTVQYITVHNTYIHTYINTYIHTCI